MLSDRQMADPDFMHCATLANAALIDMATHTGCKVEDFAEREGLDSIVDRLTAMCIRAKRTQRERFELD